nr:hypothetical protein [Herbaspirillum autotrophicum]
MYERQAIQFVPKGGGQPVSAVLEMLFSDDSACVRFFKDETCQVELAINNPYRVYVRSARCDLTTVADAVTHYSLSDLVDSFEPVAPETQRTLRTVFVLQEQTSFVCLTHLDSHKMSHHCRHQSMP